MRDLINRTALLSFMEKVERGLYEAGAAESYINGYRAAMDHVRLGEVYAPGASASDVAAYAVNMRHVAEGLLKEIPKFDDDGDEVTARETAEAMLTETREFIARMGITENA